MHPMGGADGHPGRFKTLDEITCFKCGDIGHFANKFPKGHLAFLSNNLHIVIVTIKPLSYQ